MATVVSCPTLGNKDAAEYLGLQEQTLNVWRCTQRYPLPFIRVGRKIRYRIADLDRFLESRTVGEHSAAD
jgi:excisionase family DNA binding protein